MSRSPPAPRAFERLRQPALFYGISWLLEKYNKQSLLSMAVKSPLCENVFMKLKSIGISALARLATCDVLLRICRPGFNKQ